MTTIMAFIRRHPLPIYFALTFAISWGGFVLVLGPGGLPATPEQFDQLGLVIYLAVLAGPSIAGLLMTGLVSGWAGYRDLLARLLRWQVGARWYAIALLTAPLLSAATSFGLSLIAPQFLPAIVSADDKASVLVLGLTAALMTGILEELGWTGFAIPRLRLRYGVLTTGLLVGVIWGAWHFPLFWQSDSFAGALGLAILLAGLFSWLPAYRALLVWVYDRTESLLVTMLMHVSLVVSTLTLQPMTTGVAALTFILVWAAALWIVVAAVGLASGGQVARQPLRRQVA
jgi:membrane protease YdiL (CAAX protease family)